jgi:hypothetical protein
MRPSNPVPTCRNEHTHLSQHTLPASNLAATTISPHTLIHRHLLDSILHTSRAADRTGAVSTLTSSFLLHYSPLARWTAGLVLAFTIDLLSSEYHALVSDGIFNVKNGKV